MFFFVIPLSSFLLMLVPLLCLFLVLCHTLVFIDEFCSRLVHERELQLYDGSRLLDQNRYNALKEKLTLNDEDMKER